MKKKSFLKIGGAMLLLAIVLNIQYAWGDYGIKDHPLHLEVLAQSNDTGTNTGGDGDNGSGTDTGTLWTETSKDCSVTATGAVGSIVTIFGVKLEVQAGGTATLSVSNASTSCKTGGYEQCSSLSCGNFWIQYAQANGTTAN